MERDPPRPAEQRKADSLAKLAAKAADVWVATASPTGEAYLVPLSLCWDDDRVVLAAERSTRTFANLEATRPGPPRRRPRARRGDARRRARRRCSTSPTRPTVWPTPTPPRPTGTHATRGEGYVYVVLAPERIQAWREADEIAGRTLMRGGRWLV